MSDIAAIVIVFSLVFVQGLAIGYWFAWRRASRLLRDMLYDFDAERALFDAWVRERMGQVKAEGEC